MPNPRHVWRVMIPALALSLLLIESAPPRAATAATGASAALPNPRLALADPAPADPAPADPAPAGPALAEPPPALPDPDAGELDLDGVWPAPENGLPRPGPFSTLPWLLAAALGYGALIAAKSRAVALCAARLGCRVRPLVAGGSLLRAGAAGSLLALAIAGVVWLDAPVAASLALLLALALAAHRPPAGETPLRGPGEWKPLDAETLRAESTSVPCLPGAWLDVGRWQGFTLLIALLASNAALALHLYRSSPYYGACLLLAGSALLPVFCTGRAAELPEPTLAPTRRFLARVLKSLQGKADLVLQPLGRFCTGSSELDELRLAIHPARGLTGLIGMELALEFRPGIAGPSAGPVLVIRAADGSLCQRALPRQLSWSRGRSAEERAALVRPKLPSVSLTVELILELTAAATEPAVSAPSLSAAAPPHRRLRASPAVP